MVVALSEQVLVLTDEQRAPCSTAYCRLPAKNAPRQAYKPPVMQAMKAGNTIENSTAVAPRQLCHQDMPFRCCRIVMSLSQTHPGGSSDRGAKCACDR